MKTLTRRLCLGIFLFVSGNCDVEMIDSPGTGDSFSPLVKGDSLGLLDFELVNL